jgi:hypothetical protein
VQPNLAATPMRGELEASQGVDSHRVRPDTADVAIGDGGPALLQQSADPPAQAGQVGGGDRTADGERDGATLSHYLFRFPWGRKSSAAAHLPDRG